MSTRRQLGALACVLALGTAGIAAAQPGSGIVRPTSEPAGPSTELGAQLYAGNCSSCHGISGAGVSPPRPGSGGIRGEGPPLRGVGALAADLYLRLGLMPLGGIHEQPGRQRTLFTDKEIESIVSYVASLGAGPAVPHPNPSAGNIAEGQQLFTSHCSGCHQQLARGGFVTQAQVPPLQDLQPAQIAEAVRVGPYLMPRFSARQISDAQLNSLIVYVLSTNHPNNRGGWGIGNIGPIPEGLVAWWIGGPLLLLACRALARRRKR
jgi:ubiquinol-cytochrome c reductase cytochrome c subunit